MMTTTIPLGMGGGSPFDPGRLLLYPVTLRRLFAIDFLSEVTSLSAIFALPSLFSVSIGAGLQKGRVLSALVVATLIAIFSLGLAKWLSTSIGSLMKKGKSRGESVLALVAVLAGLVGVFAPRLMELNPTKLAALRGLRWTPPGAAALALTSGLAPDGGNQFLFGLSVLAVCSFVLVAVTYSIARRLALGIGGARKSAALRANVEGQQKNYGWKLPLLAPDTAALVEKEFRYALRNAQLRTIAFMPLILLAVRFMQSTGSKQSRTLATKASSFMDAFSTYGEGLIVAGGVLYVFLVLSALTCNLFGYEGAGMRTLVMSPVDRKKILFAKNITITTIALMVATLLIGINQLVFRDVTLRGLLFGALCFVLNAAVFATIGNSLSIRFPRRLQFGKRMNSSGVSGLIVLPLLLGLAVPPLFAVAAGYFAESLFIKYATLASLAAIAVTIYSIFIKSQGVGLERRELDVLDVVCGRAGEA
jgi:hypothetical protein